MSRYVSEFAGRHNVREANTIEQMEAAFTNNGREAPSL